MESAQGFRPFSSPVRRMLPTETAPSKPFPAALPGTRPPSRRPAVRRQIQRPKAFQCIDILFQPPAADLFFSSKIVSTDKYHRHLLICRRHLEGVIQLHQVVRIVLLHHGNFTKLNGIAPPVRYSFRRQSCQIFLCLLTAVAAFRGKQQNMYGILGFPAETRFRRFHSFRRFPR